MTGGTNIHDGGSGRYVGGETPTRDDHLATKKYVDDNAGGLDVTDGTHTVSSATELDFTSGATVTDAGGGVAQVAVSGGGSLPDNVDWDENALIAYEAADSDHLNPLFRLKTLLSGGLNLSVKVAAFFTSDLTTYNDNGDELFESDSLANGGDGEVRISGVPYVPPTPTFPVSLADGESVKFEVDGDATTYLAVENSTGHLLLQFHTGADDGLQISQTEIIRPSNGSGAFFRPAVLPEVPATPTSQDVVDALIGLGLVTQAA